MAIRDQKEYFRTEGEHRLPMLNAIYLEIWTVLDHFIHAFEAMDLFACLIGVVRENVIKEHR